MHPIPNPLCHEEAQDSFRLRLLLDRAHRRPGSERLSATSAVSCANKLRSGLLIGLIAASMGCAELVAQIEVTSSGKVGIGTASPRGRLDLDPSVGAGDGLRLGDYLELNEREAVNNASTIGWNAYIAADDGTFAPWYAGSGSSGMVLSMASGGNGNLDFWGRDWASSYSPVNLSSFTHVMRLSVDGKVGIGTTTPSEKLVVAGGNLLSVNSVHVGDVHTSRYADASGDGGITLSPAGDYGNGTTIQVSKNSASGWSNLYLNVIDATATYSDSGNRYAAFYRDGSGSWAFRGDSSDNLHIAREADSGNLSIPLGNVGIGTTSPSSLLHVNGAVLASAYNTASDARLKTNIRPLTNSAAVIDALQPREFDWKSGEKDAVGFIAQELYEAAPYAVTAGDDDPKTISYQWAVDASKLVPVLTAEVKSLRSRLAEQEEATLELTDRLTRELSELRRDLAALRNR